LNDIVTGRNTGHADIATKITDVSHSLARWLQGYFNEYVWRRNSRLEDGSSFEQLLLRVASV